MSNGMEFLDFQEGCAPWNLLDFSYDIGSSKTLALKCCTFTVIKAIDVQFTW